MAFAQLRYLFRSAAVGLSAIHPLYYLAAYVLAVPIFGFTYTQLSNGFYAPYARLEYSGRSDARVIQEMIQTVLRRHAQRKMDDPPPINDGRWELAPTVVQRFSTEADSITFDLYVNARDEQKRFYLLPVTMSLQPRSSLIMYFEDAKPKIYRVFEIHEPKWAKHVLDPMQSLFEQIASDFSRAEFLPEEDLALMRFFDGLKGDALSVSDSLSRMVYFSAIVITTVGFGDIVPMTGAARFLVAFEALLGIILAGLFINAIAFRSAALHSTVAARSD
jgi:hypothetical protein